MSEGLLASLGLDEVQPKQRPQNQSAPLHNMDNFIRPGRWPAFIDKSEYQVCKKGKNLGKLQHMISYRTLHQDGSQGRAEATFTTIGTPTLDEQGNVTSVTDEMDEVAKEIYTNTLTELGVEDFKAFKPADLLNVPTSVRIVHQNGYQNVKGVFKRDGSKPIPAPQLDQAGATVPTGSVTSNASTSEQPVNKDLF